MNHCYREDLFKVVGTKIDGNSVSGDLLELFNGQPEPPKSNAIKVDMAYVNGDWAIQGIICPTANPN